MALTSRFFAIGLPFKLHSTTKYGLEALAISYRKATSRRLVVVDLAIRSSLTDCCISDPGRRVSETTLNNLDANALTYPRFEEVYILILPSSSCTVVEQQFVWTMLQAEPCGSRSLLCEESLKWPTNGRTRGSSGSRARDRLRLT